MGGSDISFVNLGITIQHLRNSVSVFGFRVTYYGIIIGLGMLAGLFVAQADAKRRGQNPELYSDYALYGIICSIVGARIYYVAFAWDTYKDDLIQIFNIRGGGLAIYGGVIAAAVSLLMFTRWKRVSFLSMADTACLGLITGQSIGRWGNFFNCEAFGGYTENLFAMRIRKSLVNSNMLSQELLDRVILDRGIEYIQVHPTFLYESAWSLLLLILLLWYRKYKKFDGEMMLLYFLGYGFGRFWIEGLRTDQLILFQTGIPVSQALSLLLVLVSGGVLLYRHMWVREMNKGE